MREAAYQARIIKTLYDLFPGCVIIKNDPEYLQGIPDLIILFGRSWAMLEVKAYRRAPKRPNQDYYIELLGRMSFAAFIYPENEVEVLDALQHAFESERDARIP